MKGLVIIVICLATLLLLFPYDQISDEEQQFIDFIRIYKRSYQSEEEYKHRLQVFIKNLIKMEELRIRNPRARFAVNDFADRTEDEMKQNFGFVKNTQRRYNKQTEVSGTNVDWSSLWTTVKNQGNCGSCWAFSAIASFEGRYTISVGKKTVQDLYSEQQLVDCVKACKGCKGGDMDDGFQYLVKNKICLESEYPYKAVQSTCQDSTCVGPHVKGFSSFGYEDENGILQGLAQGPISVAVDASSWSSYSGGILEDDLCFFILNHGVTLVAVNFDQQYAKIRNSWGSNWGEGGYIRLATGRNTCGYAEQASVPTF